MNQLFRSRGNISSGFVFSEMLAMASLPHSLLSVFVSIELFIIENKEKCRRVDGLFLANIYCTAVKLGDNSLWCDGRGQTLPIIMLTGGGGDWHSSGSSKTPKTDSLGQIQMGICRKEWAKQEAAVAASAVISNIFPPHYTPPLPPPRLSSILRGILI